MCDGIADETTWTIKHRATGLPLEAAGGFTFVFAEESEALDFLRSRLDAAALEVSAISVPEL